MLTLPNLPNRTLKALKSLAARHGRSAEAEACAILAGAFHHDRERTGVKRLGHALGTIWAPLDVTNEERARMTATAPDNSSLRRFGL